MSRPGSDTPTTPNANRMQLTNRRLWAWAVTVSAMSAIANAIVSDSWGWRTAFLIGLAFVAGTLVCRGVMAVYLRTKRG
jgi:hypothetical protein